MTDVIGPAKALEAALFAAELKGQAPAYQRPGAIVAWLPSRLRAALAELRSEHTQVRIEPWKGDRMQQTALTITNEGGAWRIDSGWRAAPRVIARLVSRVVSELRGPDAPWLRLGRSWVALVFPGHVELAEGGRMALRVVERLTEAGFAPTAVAGPRRGEVAECRRRPLIQVIVCRTGWPAMTRSIRHCRAVYEAILGSRHIEGEALGCGLHAFFAGDGRHRGFPANRDCPGAGRIYGDFIVTVLAKKSPQDVATFQAGLEAGALEALGKQYGLELVQAADAYKAQHGDPRAPAEEDAEP